MLDFLANSPDSADALVDIANVVRNDRLGGCGPADLDRLERVAGALAELYGSAGVALFGIADRALLAQSDLFLDPRQLRTLRDLAGLQQIHVADKADVDLLQAAWETGLPIITSDQFRGHRREFPWLNERDDAVLLPWADDHGNVALRHVTLGRRADWELSISEERDLLVQQGIDARIEVLGRYWSCPDRRCPRHEPASKPFILLPLVRGGRLICDLHGREMIDQGARPRMAQLKILRDGALRDRFTVVEGEPVEVGRSGTGVDLCPFLDGALLARASRRHLRFDVDPGGLTITDLSTNGTTLFLRDGSRVPLRRESRSFSVGDRAEVVPGLEIVRSGRQYPSELRGRPAAPAAEAGPAAQPTMFL
jgi:hypothetical protein